MLEYMLLRPAERHLAERLAEMRGKLANYKRFRELTDEWVELVVELEQQERERNR
jgi:seryl-tRNA synthetase